LSSAAPARAARRPPPRQTRPCRVGRRDGVPYAEAAQQSGVEVVQTRPVFREEQPVNPFGRVPRCQPICVSHGHTSAGRASMLIAWLVRRCGCATNSSPGIRIRRSSAVEPARRPKTCSAPYPTSTDLRTYQPIRSTHLQTLPQEAHACSRSDRSALRRSWVHAQSGRVRCRPRPDTVRGTKRTGSELADPAQGTGGRRSSS